MRYEERAAFMLLRPVTPSPPARRKLRKISAPMPVVGADDPSRGLLSPSSRVRSLTVTNQSMVDSASPGTRMAAYQRGAEEARCRRRTLTGRKAPTGGQFALRSGSGPNPHSAETDAKRRIEEATDPLNYFYVTEAPGATAIYIFLSSPKTIR